MNRQAFRTYHLPQVTGILPALSATMFGVSCCITYLYCSSVFWGTLFGEWLCLLLISFLCFLGDVVWCVAVCVTYIVFVFFGGGKKMVQRIMEVVADYEDCVNVTTSSALAT